MAVTSKRAGAGEGADLRAARSETRRVQAESDQRLAEESADLVYHLMVVLAQRRVPLARVLEVLAARRSGP